MITLVAIVVFVLFLKLVGFVFGLGLRILGWLIGAAGFVISILLAVSVIGVIFDLLPILLVVGVILLARKTS